MCTFRYSHDCVSTIVLLSFLPLQSSNPQDLVTFLVLKLIDANCPQQWLTVPEIRVSQYHLLITFCNIVNNNS